MSNPLPKQQPTTYNIEHFYWGKHIQDKNPIGEFRIVATSTGWQLDGANHAFYNRIYGGSHNGVELLELDTQITIGSISNHNRSDLLLAFIERSTYVERSTHYPIYHVFRLPVDLVERFNYALDLLVQPLYELHAQQPVALYEHLVQNLAPLKLDLNAVDPQPSTALATLLQLPFAQSNDNQVLLLNQLLNGGKIVITNAPRDVLIRLKTIIGFMQWFPLFARQRIQGSSSVFKSADSPLNIQFLYSEIYSAPVAGALIANWETGTIKMPPVPPQHPYTLLATQISTGKLTDIQQIQHDLEKLFQQHNTTPRVTSDPLYSIAWRYGYDKSHFIDDDTRAKALKSLIHKPLNPDHIIDDLKALVELAISTKRTELLSDMLDTLTIHDSVIQQILADYRPQKRLFDFIEDVLNTDQVRLAQWFFQRIMKQEGLANTLISTYTSLACRLLKQRLLYRQPGSIDHALNLLMIADKKRKNSLSDLGDCILDSVIQYDADELEALVIFFDSPLLDEHQIALFSLLHNAQVPLMRFLPESQDLLERLPNHEALRHFNQALESATLASYEDIWQAIMSAPDTDSTKLLSTPRTNDDPTRSANIDSEQASSHDEFMLGSEFHIAFLRHLLRHETFVIRASDALLNINATQWKPTVDEALSVLDYSQQSAQRDALYMHMVQACVTWKLTMTNRSVYLQALSEAYNKPLQPDAFRLWLSATGRRTPLQFLWQLRQVTSFMAQSYEAGGFVLDDLPILSSDEQEGIRTEIEQIRELIQSFSRGRLFSGKSEEAERILATLDQLSNALQLQNSLEDPLDMP